MPRFLFTLAAGLATAATLPAQVGLGSHGPSFSSGSLPGPGFTSRLSTNPSVATALTGGRCAGPAFNGGFVAPAVGFGGFGSGFGHPVGFGGFGYGVGYGGFGPYAAYPLSPYLGSYAAAQAFSQPAVAAGPAYYLPAVPTPPRQVATDGSAQIRFDVPADAEVFVNGKKVEQEGTVRLYSTPPLRAGQAVQVSMTVKWKENGRPVEQPLSMLLEPGDRKSVNVVAAR